jgi:hypothetical protein
VEKYGTAGQATDDNIIRRMRFACWITKATDTHSEYVVLIAFPRQQWSRERASVLHLYMHALCCLLSHEVMFRLIRFHLVQVILEPSFSLWLCCSGCDTPKFTVTTGRCSGLQSVTTVAAPPPVDISSVAAPSTWTSFLVQVTSALLSSYQPVSPGATLIQHRNIALFCSNCTIVLHRMCL